jgi:prepilin-type N-terminal cleavage/methylation domain-containing protein
VLRTRTTRPARRGFSLVELLTVVSVIAVLAALVTGTIGKIRAAQLSKDTEETLSKLHSALDAQRSALVRQCKADRLNRSTEFQAVANFCGNDDDRAEALWLLIKMRHEFPQSVAEATTAINLAGVNLQPKLTFKSVTAAAAAQPELQSAILLYLNLSEKSRAGVEFQADLVAAADVAVGNGSFRVFRDAWGLPIAFARHAQNQELNGADYVKQVANRDPFDPKGRLAAAWPTPANQTAAQTALGIAFNNQNRSLTAISAGPNKAFEGINNSLAGDDIYSYRTKKQGNRAD